MSPRRSSLIVTSLALMAIGTSALAEKQIDLEMTRLSDRVLTVSGLTGNSRAVAVASERGLVLLDCFWAPGIAAEARGIIEQEFGRSDFAYVIFTNSNDLSSRGSGTFPAAVIVAHEDCKEDLIAHSSTLDEDLRVRADEFHERVVRSQERLKETEEGSERAQLLREWIDLCERVEEDMRKGYEIVLPDITFSDRMTIDLGDLTLELIYFGEAGNDGDIMVRIPEESFVFLGDVFHAGHSLPYTHLAGKEMGITRWIAVLDTLLGDPNEIRHVVRANGKGMWTAERLQQQRDLIHEIWQGVEAADAEGLGLEEAIEKFTPVEEKFPFVEEWDTYKTYGADILTGDVRRLTGLLWQESHQSAALEIAALIETEGIEAGEQRFREVRARSDNKYYFVENEFNSKGYGFLNAGKHAEAIAVFRFAVAAFPESWNTYDSLGEAYMKNGETALAIENYRKSLELNPDNTNAGEMLETLED